MSPPFNPFTPEFLADPYPFYRRLREADPVHYWEILGQGFWILTRHADVAGALRDPRLSSASTPRAWLPHELTEGNVFYQDPPDHTRLRGLINKAFLPQVLAAMRPRLKELILELIGQLRGAAQRAGRFDIVTELAVPLSLRVIAQILGLPRADLPQLKRWSDELAVLLDAARMLRGVAAAKDAAPLMVAYFRRTIAARSGRPAALDSREPDLLDALIAARQQGDQLSESELIATSVFLLIAGHETMTNLIGSGLLLLFEHPEELLRLRADPALVPHAIEEMLRYEPPVLLTIRVATGDLLLDGRRIRQGQFVCAVTAAANRDPAVFADPERFAIAPRDSRHLAFGNGPHFCIGGALARLQGQLLLEALLTELPTLHIDPADAVRAKGLVLRGLSSLPARL